MATPRTTREPGRAESLLAHLRWFSLDARLVAGEDPSRSRLLAAQAARLTAPRQRNRLAAALNGLLVAAEHGPYQSRVSPSRSAVFGNERAVRELARRVESGEALYARGLARLERLLSDSTGPVFRGGTGELAEELEHVAAELSGRPSGVATDPGGRPSGVAAELSGRPSGAPMTARRAIWARRGRSVRRLARVRSGRRPGSPVDPPGFANGSFALPDGSWFHGRRDGA